jgi:hypothetical protein
MARKKQGEVPTKPGEKKELAFGEWQFVRHQMTRDEKTAFREWQLTGEDLVNMLDRLVDGSYKVSVSSDDYNKCNQATLTCKDTKSDDYGYILVGRASSAFDALKVVLYKHYVLLVDGWQNWVEREADDDVMG